MPIFTYLSFAVSPILIIVLIFYLKYKFSIKNFTNIRNAIIWGMVSVILLVIFSFFIEQQWGGNLRNMRRMAFFVFVIIAFGSEFAKYLALNFGFYKLRTFEGPLEGVVYSIFIGLGFSTIATVLYAYDIVGTSGKFNEMYLFLFTFPFANIVFGIVMGFFIGMGKLRKNWLIDNSTGMFVATFFHGLYYFSFITADKRLLIFTAIGFVIIASTLVLKAANIRQSKN